MWVMATNTNSRMYNTTYNATKPANEIVINIDNIIHLYVNMLRTDCFCIHGCDIQGYPIDIGIFNTEEKAKTALDKIMTGIMQKKPYCRIFDDMEENNNVD